MIVGTVDGRIAAAKAGIRPGDRIVSVAGRDVDNVGGVLRRRRHTPNREVPIGCCATGSRQSRTITPTLPPAEPVRIGDIGVLPNVHPTSRSVNAGRTGERAGPQGRRRRGGGRRPADHLPLAVPARPSPKQPDQPITMSILRNGARWTCRSTPGRARDLGLLGIPSVDERQRQAGFGEAITLSVQKNIEMARLIFQTLGGLFTRETSPKQLMGPVAIAQLSGESAQLGWIALISADGVDQSEPRAAEPDADAGARRRAHLHHGARRAGAPRLQPAVKEKMLMAGFAVMLMLMVTVIYNDLTRISWIERLMPWR